MLGFIYFLFFLGADSATFGLKISYFIEVGLYEYFVFEYLSLSENSSPPKKVNS